jgi:flagellar FliL protein
MLFLVILVVALGAAGGGFFYFQRAGAAVKGKAEKGKRDGTLLSKKAKAEEGETEEQAEEGAADEEAPETGKKNKAGSKSIDLSLPNDRQVKQVIELQPFIVNLADKGEARYLRLTVSLGLGEGGEEKPDPLFTTRVRNAMLAVLTTKTSDEILTVEGKSALRKELLRAARAASEEPKVLAVYITDFIVQL